MVRWGDGEAETQREDMEEQQHLPHHYPLPSILPPSPARGGHGGWKGVSCVRGVRGIKGRGCVYALLSCNLLHCLHAAGSRDDQGHVTFM